MTHTVSEFKNKTLVVFGLGKSGLSSIHALKASGTTVLAGDDRPLPKDLGIEPLDLASVKWEEIEALVLAPGVPHTYPQPHPVAKAAKAANVPIIGDIELFVRANPTNSFAGITGTNGKSTTTALTGHVLNHAKVEAQVGGNLGFPVLELPISAPGSWQILELSSYQLELCPSLHCKIAVLLNISPDHLGRHGGIEGYVAAKKNIFRKNASDQLAIVGVDTPESKSIFNWLKDTRPDNPPFAISTTQPVEEGAYVLDGILHDCATGDSFDLKAIRTLQGQHNWQNAAAAYLIAKACGVAPKNIITGLETFPGLIHRQEYISSIGRISFINDSKATNAEATEVALKTYPNIFWIAGGLSKEGGIDNLTPYLANVECAYLIGRDAPLFARALEGHCPYIQCGDLQTAIIKAYQDANATSLESPTILMSPACASFDQYENFEARGDAFKVLVAKLAKDQETS